MLPGKDISSAVVPVGVSGEGTMTQKVLPLVYLKPAELFVAREPTIIKTLLGSCVAICLYSAKLRCGAMCHCTLPYKNQFGHVYDNKVPFSFVDTALEHMLDKLCRAGTKICELEAKLFGGADVTPVIGTRKRPVKTIGQQNIAAARERIKTCGVRLSSEKVGGRKGYKILFNTENGKVNLIHLENSSLIHDGAGGERTDE